MNMPERVFEEVRALPEYELREVLDFLGYLKSRHGLSTLAASNVTAVDWDGLQRHARGLISDPIKSPDLALMDEVGCKVCRRHLVTRRTLRPWSSLTPAATRSIPKTCKTGGYSRGG